MFKLINLPELPSFGRYGNFSHMSTLTIELSDALAARLAAASERHHVPPAQIVQEALELTLPDEAPEEPPTKDESLAERMKDLIGCFDSGVSDLSTNPKYMEGFGQWRR